ncbi:centrosome-associated protein Alms1a-like [Episyrphus balteatus]|uniref:centrosome-associated protein Alms1a-like n=1 Tax=Episyrphus balteatus TaxID=286459 RepID=UPI0024867AF7|nr:centrosome-associated protein Alms1a-like [Episyrphus balteatus]
MSSSDFPSCSKFVKSKSVNNKIIDYYLKYAKDRDIEKFMRFTHSSTSGNSSSNSCPCPLLTKSSSESDENSNLVKEELIIALQPCENVNELNKENIGQEANKIPSEPRTPPKVTETIFQVPDSVTKIDKKLEWDSLGDVGYKKANSTGNLSSLERSVLKELFSESPSVPNIPHQRSDELKPISTHSLSAESRREKWRQTLENLGKKYSSRSNSLNTQEFMELPQSTPKVVPNTDKSCQTTLDKTKTNVLVKTRTNHSCQTSFDRTKVPETYSQLKTQETQANLSSRAESFATQSSFEYVSGGDKRRQSESSQKSSSLSSTRRSILSEKSTNKSHSSTPPDSVKDKDQLTKRTTNRSSKTEVDLGIKLLCSLIDAKNLTSMQKKNLAKKIFEKITKQSDDASSGGSSSVSSAFSIRSLNNSNSPPLVEEDQKQKIAIPNKVSVEQMSEETQTEELPKVEEDQNPPQSSPSLEEPVTMREWLHPLTRSEKDYEKKLKQKSQTMTSVHASERSKQLSWIEMEINRLEGLKNLILQDCPSRSRSQSSSSTIKSSRGKSEIIYEETAEDLVNEEDQYKRTTVRRTSQNVVIYDEPTAEKKHPEKVSYKTINEGDLVSSSNSLKNNHRSKLETPSSSPSTERESVGAFADHLQKQFMDSYEKKKHTMSAEHYSEPRICGKPIFTRNPSYTSVASSAFCMSSEMSIPIVESTSTSTTTHQYDSNGCDSIEGVAIQTSYSVIKSDPIFGPRCRCICTCGKECKCSCPRPTVRVSGKSFHQTVQVKPKALAYVIRFNETSDGQGNKITEDGVSLQKRLEMKMPDFCSKANERREILKKLHALRQEREARIREIADSSSVSSISRKLGELPPPPIKQVRICPSREMKGMTKKRYCKLPEVVAKQEREKLERRKKTTRVITNIFNKKLQRMVHNGKLSLENSRTVI